jgi:hypothetical protein
MRQPFVITALTVAALATGSTSSYAVSIGIIDTFSIDEQNWFAGGLGPPPVSFPPVPPNQIPNGGPTGDGDGFLQITATGGSGAGSRLVAMNGAQWAGNYLAAGVKSISMDLQNQSSTDLVIRLLFENPIAGPPTDEGITSFGAVLPANSDWMHFVFPIRPSALEAEIGDMNTLLSNVTLMRIIHSEDPDDADRVTGQLGVDNIRANAAPEPATIFLMMSGLGAAALRRRRP